MGLSNSIYPASTVEEWRHLFTTNQIIWANNCDYFCGKSSYYFGDTTPNFTLKHWQGFWDDGNIIPISKCPCMQSSGGSTSGGSTSGDILGPGGSLGLLPGGSGGSLGPLVGGIPSTSGGSTSGTGSAGGSSFNNTDCYPSQIINVNCSKGKKGNGSSTTGNDTSNNNNNNNNGGLLGSLQDKEERGQQIAGFSGALVTGIGAGVLAKKKFKQGWGTTIVAGVLASGTALNTIGLAIEYPELNGEKHSRRVADVVGNYTGIGAGAICKLKFKKGWGWTILSGLVGGAVGRKVTYELLEYKKNTNK